MPSFISVKGRTLLSGQAVEVYFNLHKHVFSIRDKKTKLVLAHAENVLLKNVTFKVSQKGREKTVASKQKGVHAFLVGEFVSSKATSPSEKWKSAYYNPYLTETFIDFHSKETLTDAAFVYCEKKRVYYT